jgi:exopolysaccharide production protein ExoQ
LPPAVALLVYSLVVLCLIWHDRKTDARSSPALWLPIIWLFLLGSRLPSQWMGRTSASTAAAFADGSGLDRTIFLVLMALGIGVLSRRRLDWGKLLTANIAISVFVVFAFLSVLWSDFPLVTFKRWFRDLGMYLMILVVVTHADPIESISTFVRRLSYVLVFLSVLLIKYYPMIGVSYNIWSGAAEYAGATTSKNMLGAVCIISGMFFFWDTLRRWPQRKSHGVQISLAVNVAMIAMTLWLLVLSNSATSKGCLVIGCGVIALLKGKWALKYPRAVKALIPATLSLYVVLELVFDLSTSIALFLGRDPTLHGRTGIWEALLSVENNPLVGVGYQTFWLGERLDVVFRLLDVTFLNEAHNGYLEMYLSLGAIGVVFLILILLSSYWKLVQQFARAPLFASLGLSLWSVMVVYNLTEAAFPASFAWAVFLICAVGVPLSSDTRLLHPLGALPLLSRHTNVRAVTRTAPRRIPLNPTGQAQSAKCLSRRSNGPSNSRHQTRASAHLSRRIGADRSDD